ncbi:DHA2 family metal-tetracycline-proton antiporter-like MFS transporter [Kineosphaera limosa]|uniref:Putative drug resistance transporter n=1 Tax=Kineosphaera limosa NBRC 100340 TaxID=1184609 RepID=K6XAU0_9MICO|nr:MFS transporter [Kineosphaera limosa]NYE01273.1 DHA2 family metal-tetracycline-proton antiporter-like MFS transporter [Kineosphaera limosa]GAB95929.1 putative drug resistance transporter [Kineosphaera limosa NBRC 100340]
MSSSPAPGNGAATAVPVADVPNPKRAVPVLLGMFIFCLVVDSAFRFTSKPIADDLGLSVTTVSLQTTLGGIIIGVGAVVFATLSDSISMRKLLLGAIGMICVGSLIGFFFSSSWPMILTGRIIQTSGLAAAETLYVVYVTKYLPKEDQRTYLGFSTAAFQLAMLIGIVTTGFISTYVSWTALFLVPLLCLLAVPAVLKTIPDHQLAGSRLDVFGIVLVAIVATGTMLFLQDFNWLFLAPAAVGVGLLWWHIRTHHDALVDRAFFADLRYPSTLVVVFFLYAVQFAYIFAFPFLITELYGMSFDTISLLTVPGYVCAVIVGSLSGKIGERLSMRATITLAVGLIIVALVVPAVFVTTSVIPFVLSLVVFSSGFALLYAPLVATAIRDITPVRSGVAIGFYNLMISIAVSVGIAYTAKLLDLKPALFDAIITAPEGFSKSFSNSLLLIAVVALIGLIIYRAAAAVLARDDQRAGRESALGS